MALVRLFDGTSFRGGDADLDRERERLVEIVDTESESDVYEDTDSDRLRVAFPEPSCFDLGFVVSSTGLIYVRLDLCLHLGREVLTLVAPPL